MNFDLFSIGVGIAAVLLMLAAFYLYRSRVNRSFRSWVARVRTDTKAAPPAELMDSSNQLKALQQQIADYDASARKSAGESELAAAHTRFLQTVLELSTWQGTRDELIRRLLSQLEESLRAHGVVYFAYHPEFKGFRAAISSDPLGHPPPEVLLHPDQHPFFLRRMFTTRGGLSVTPADAEDRFILEALSADWVIVTLLRKEGDLFGAIAAYGKTPAADLPRRQEMFTYYSDAITVLMQNLAIRESIHRRIQDLELLHEINLQISSILEFDHILRFSVERVAEAFHTDIATIELVEGDVLRIVASHGMSLDLARSFGALKLGESLSGKVAVTGKPLLVENVLEHPDFKFKTQGQEAGMVSYLGVPIVITGKLIGVLSVITRLPRIFTLHDADLLSTISSSLGVFIEQANLYNQLQAKLTELEQTRLQLGGYTHELESVNRELVMLNRLRSEFVSSVTHELRTPLTVVKGYSSMLRAGVFGELGAEHIRLLSIMEHQIGEMDRIIRDLLDISRIETGSLEVHPEVQNPRPFLSQMSEEYAPLARAKGVTLTARVDTAPALCSFDPVRFRQAVRNLIDNALKFTPSGGRITITSAVMHRNQLPERLHEELREPQYWVVTVEDTGIGIPPADLEKVFERFYQVRPTSRDREAVGAGIGLYLTRHIVNAHRGRIWVESELQRGSRFSFTLPVVAETLQEREEAARAAPALLHHTLLVIQPGYDPSKAGSLEVNGPAGWLGAPDRFGLDVVRVENADEALRRAREIAPDFVVTFLPFSPGLMNFYARLVAEPALHHVPFLVCPPGKFSEGSRVLALDSEESFRELPDDWPVEVIQSPADLRSRAKALQDVRWVCFLNFPLSPDVAPSLLALQAQGAVLLFAGLRRVRETVEFMQSLFAYGGAPR